MTIEDDLIEEYFDNNSIDIYCTNEVTGDLDFTIFYECVACAAVVKWDKLTKHAAWHEETRADIKLAARSSTRKVYR